MGFQDYISEEEASSLSGVSVSTLSRFVEAGYLRTETDSDGLRLFSKSELQSVFGLDSFHTAGREKPITLKSSIEVPRPEITRKTVDINSKAAPIPAEKRTVERQPVPEEPASAAPILSQPERRPENAAVPSTPPDVASHATESGPKAAAQSTEDRKASERIYQLEMELLKLKQVTLLQEQLLETKEARIRDIEEQRTWLKSRLEKLEEKGERDQLLLLAESQTVRKLIQIQEKKRSPLRLALEWLGLGMPEQRSQTIEIGHLPRQEKQTATQAAQPGNETA